MSKRYFFPRNESERLTWLQSFSNKLGSYATKYDIPAGDVTDTTNGYTSMAYWTNYANQYKGFVSKLVGYRNELGSSTEAAAVEPGPPVLPAAPTAVDPGVYLRAVAIANRIKSHNLYAVSDGNDLGIEGDEITPPDINSAKPIISVRLIGGGNPEIVWVRGSFDGIDIYVDRGNGTWVFLATDTIPNFTDTGALPAAGQSAVWKYRTIYRLDDAHVGQWSDEKVITVTGIV